MALLSRGFEDSRTSTDLPNTGEPKPSDPEWVERVDPDKMPKYMTKSNQEVAGGYYFLNKGRCRRLNKL